MKAIRILTSGNGGPLMPGMACIIHLCSAGGARDGLPVRGGACFGGV